MDYLSFNDVIKTLSHGASTIATRRKYNGKNTFKLRGKTVREE